MQAAKREAQKKKQREREKVKKAAAREKAAAAAAQAEEAAEQEVTRAALEAAQLAAKCASTRLCALAGCQVHWLFPGVWQVQRWHRRVMYGIKTLQFARVSGCYCFFPRPLAPACVWACCTRDRGIALECCLCCVVPSAVMCRREPDGGRGKSTAVQVSSRPGGRPAPADAARRREMAAAAAEARAKALAAATAAQQLRFALPPGNMTPLCLCPLFRARLRTRLGTERCVCR